jgi:hypothetical protein
MWANSVWGLFGTFSFGFALAALVLGPDQAWLRPWFIGGAILCFAVGVIVLCGPLYKVENRIKMRDALRHPRKWIAKAVEPSQLIFGGFIIIVVGAAIVGIGLFRQSRQPQQFSITQRDIDELTRPLREQIGSLKEQLAQRKTAVQPPQVQAPAFFGGGPTTEAPEQRRFTNRSVRELRALYDGKTAFQADKLMEPYKGMWIETEGTIAGIYADGNNGGAVAVLRNNNDTVECRFSADWARDLGRYNNGEVLKVRGKLSNNQNGQQIYLVYCEVLS